MRIVVTKLINEAWASRACSFTVGAPINIKNMYKMYKSEHSPIRAVTFAVEMFDIPTYVSVHLVRHKFGVEHYVRSNRPDRGGNAEADRDTPVNHMMIINAQALISMARKRLCYGASEGTRKLFEQLREEIRAIDAPLAEAMVPDCKYRGKCNEFYPCKERRSI